MHAVALRRRNEGADFFQTFGRQPALAAAALDGKTVGRFFIGAAELVSALVRVDPLLDGRRYLVEQPRVHDQKARISGAVIVELVVDDSRTLAAELFAAIELELAGRYEMRLAADVIDILLRRRGCVLGAAPRPKGQAESNRKTRQGPRQNLSFRHAEDTSRICPAYKPDWPLQHGLKRQLVQENGSYRKTG